MLVLTYKTPPEDLADRGDPKEKEWHVGDQPLREQLDINNLQVLSIVADDAEIIYIRQRFSNLPIVALDLNRLYRAGNQPDPGECVWRGEFARFIFDNL